MVEKSTSCDKRPHSATTIK